MEFELINAIWVDALFVNSEYISFTVILCLMFTFNIYLCASAKAGLKTKVSIVDQLM